MSEDKQVVDPEEETALVVDPAVADVPDTVPTYWVYLGGPMTNQPKFNFPKFAAAAAWLRENGWGVFSPAEKDLQAIPLEVMETIPGYEDGNLAEYTANSSFTMANAMEWDLPAIQKSQGIVLLEGWEQSTGARWERTVAEALGRDIWLLCEVDGPDEPFPFVLVPDNEPTQITDFLRGFGQQDDVAAHHFHEGYDAGKREALSVQGEIAEPSPAELPTPILVETLKGRLAHVPGTRELFNKLEATVVLQ